MSNFHHLEPSISANIFHTSCTTYGESAQPSRLNLSPPTKFHGRKSGLNPINKTTGAQQLESDKRQLVESSHQIFGRMIAREEAAQWSCTTDELEEISASVADELLMLMRPKL
jgi:hypothetical protein